LSLVARTFVLIGLMLSFDTGHEIYDGLERRADATAELNRRAASLAQIAALDIERTFEAARQTMTVLSMTPAIRDHDLQACSGLLQSVKRNLPMYDFISPVDLDGRILCTSSSLERADVRGDSRKIANDAANRDFAIGVYAQGKLTGNEVIRLSYPILASDGSVSGVLVAGLNLNWLNASIAG
jgi:hypothetical protein